MTTNKKKNNHSQFSIFILLILFIIKFPVYSQVSTLDDYKGSWTNPSSWTSGIQPSPLTTSIVDGITINGYITRTGDLTFANVNQANDLLINDTLVIDGSVTFANKSTNLIIPSGGLMIVFSDFSADNKIEVNNGGLLIVMGNMSFSNSPQDDYIDNGGGLYVDGTVNGNATADGIDLPIADLITDGLEDIYDFVTSAGNTPLPVELLFFAATPSENEVILQWSTASELNNDFFTLERSRNGKDFEVIAKVEGNGTSHIQIDYNYSDGNPYLGLSYYRLSQTDYDGTTEIFPSISVLFDGNSRLNIFPNPVDSESLKIQSSGHQSNELLRVSIFSLQGIKMANYQLQADVFGNLDSHLNMNHNWKSGTYVLELLSSNSREIIKINKE